MPARHAYEYAVVRIVPRVERGEFINAGVVLYCRARRFLETRSAIDRRRLSALAPDIDLAAVAEVLQHWAIICRGGPEAGELGALPQAERFRWITAPRSTIVQTSPVHCGLLIEPGDELERLFDALVAPPSPPTDIGRAQRDGWP